MEMKITERDRRLLHILFVFVWNTCLLVMVSMPLYSERNEWEMRCRIQAEQIELARKQAEALPELRREHEQYRRRRDEAQAEYYPMLEPHEIDGMLTGFVTEEGILIRRLSMEKQAVWTGDHVQAVTVTMELTGTSEQLNHLLETWEIRLNGSRILEFSWEETAKNGEHTGENLRGLHLKAAVFMCRKEVENDGQEDGS